MLALLGDRILRYSDSRRAQPFDRLISNLALRLGRIISHRLAVEYQNQGSRKMTKCRDGYYGPYKDSVVILGRSGNQSQIVEAEGSFESSNSELIEWATGIIELLVSINTLFQSE